MDIRPDELEGRIGEMDPGVAIIGVCSAGYRSSQAARMLAAAGFCRVMNLKDGVRGYGGPWEAECRFTMCRFSA